MSATDIVRAWRRNKHNEQPTSPQFRAAIVWLLIQWETDKRDGNDSLASAMLDEIAEILSELRDL